MILTIFCRSFKLTVAISKGIHEFRYFQRRGRAKLLGLNISRVTGILLHGSDTGGEKMTYRKTLIGAAAMAFLLPASGALAADPAFGGNTLRANPSVKMTNMTMTVTGPNDYYSKSYSEYQSPFMSLSQNGSLADGIYNWELTGATSERVEANPMGLNNGRGDSARQFVNKSMTESGTFRVLNGSIVAPDGAVEEAATGPKKSSLSPFGR